MSSKTFACGVIAAVATMAAARAPTCDELHAMNYEYDFETYIQDFSKNYAVAEIASRRAAFESNLDLIKSHNSDTSNTWKMGVNDYADLTSAEFASAKLGFNKAAAYQMRQNRNSAECTLEKQPLPASVDWRDKNVVTPPKNQGGCGSCWAFSTAETLESHIAIKTGKLMTFSEQEFVDCVENPDDCGGTGGCQGATQWLGFEYAMKHGVTLESDYPYTARTGTCQPDKIKPVANISGYCRLPHVADNFTAEMQYDQLMQAVTQVGPIAISASAEPWQLYERGVFSSASCGGDDVDHAIQLVGYGTDAGKDYWLVRNSWGEIWGEQGYIRIERLGASGTPPCEMDKTPGDGTACKNSPKEIKVCGICGILSDSSYPIGGKLV